MTKITITPFCQTLFFTKQCSSPSPVPTNRILTCCHWRIIKIEMDATICMAAPKQSKTCVNSTPCAFQPLKPKYPHINSPYWCPHIFLWYYSIGVDKRTKQLPLGNHSTINSHQLHWIKYCTVRRTCMLVTLGTWRVFINKVLSL